MIPLPTYLNLKYKVSIFTTPHRRHTGEDEAIRIKRHDVYKIAKLAHPERWSKDTRNWLVNKVATLNPNKKLNYLKGILLL